MNSFKQVWTGAICICLIAFLGDGLFAQSATEKSAEKPIETEIIVIEETVDKYGNKTVKKTITKGTDMSDEELEKYIKEQVGGDFDIESITTDGETEITIEAHEAHGNKAYLGIYLDQAEEGVRVSRVIEGSAAEKGGLQNGDVIVAIGGDITENSDQLVEAISRHEPGDAVEVVYLRNGEKLTTTTTLTSKEAVESDHVERRIEKSYKHLKEHGAHKSDKEEMQKPRLGVRIDQADEGVLIQSVDSGSHAEAMGLMEGDIITKFNNTEVADINSLVTAVKMAEANTPITVEFLRDGKTMKKEVKFD